MNADQQKRAESALDELANEMSIEPLPGGEFRVKGEYEVDPVVPSCTCPDHEYRNHRCKHIIAVKLEILWGNVTPMLDDEEGAPPRPDVLTPSYPNVPGYLREFDNWVCWEQSLIENKDGTQRWTKVPVDVENGGFASSTDPETWTDFETAIEFDKRTHTATAGIGFVIGDSDIVGIDIDDCRDPDSGAFEPTVARLLSNVESYAEVSPSGTGVRIFVRGEKSTDACQGDLPGEAHVEMYDNGRYLTVTGHHIESTGEEVIADETTLEAFEAICEDETEEGE